MKKLFYILGGLLALFVIVVVVVLLMLDSIVKAGVNNYGPKITQTKVELGDVTISPFSGRGSLKNLTVGNPAGWQTDHAFFLKEISIDLVPGSVVGDPIIINSILIDNPEIVYEMSGLNKSNLQDLMKNIQQAGGNEQAQQPQPETKTTPQAQNGPQKKIEIKSFRMVNVTIKVVSAGNTYTVNIPDLVLTDLGTKEGGLTPDKLTLAILRDIASQAGKAALKAAASSTIKDKAIEGLRGLFGK